MNLFHRLCLWHEGANDIPELMALEPAEAMKVIAAARQAEINATFWDTTSARNIVMSFGVVLLVIVMIAAGVLTGHRDIVDLAGFVAGVFGLGYVVFGRGREIRKLRPRVYEALKARAAEKSTPL